MGNKRAGKCKRSTVLALIFASTVLIGALGVVFATVIVQSEDHPRMTTIDPHTALTPVSSVPTPTTTTTTATTPYVVPEFEPPISEDPVLPTTTEVTPWSPPETTTTTTTTARVPWTPSIISPPHVPTMHCVSFKPLICTYY